MNIKIDDKKTVFFVVLILKTENKFNIFLKIQKQASNQQHAIELTEKEAVKSNPECAIVAKTIAMLTPEIFID